MRPAGSLVRFATRKSEALLAYLLVRSNITHRRDRLSMLLWSEVPSAQARHSLRQTLSDIRTAVAPLGRDVVMTSSDTVVVATAGVRVDVRSLEGILQRRRTPRALKLACALYRGEFLEGLDLREPEFETWLVAERARLRQLGIDAHEAYLRSALSNGDLSLAIQTGLCLLSIDPLQEWAHRMLVSLYMKRRQFAAAVRQYQTCVNILSRELGVEPEPETKRLWHELTLARARSQPEEWDRMLTEEAPKRSDVAVEKRSWAPTTGSDVPPRDRWQRRNRYDK